LIGFLFHTVREPPHILCFLSQALAQIRELVLAAIIAAGSDGSATPKAHMASSMVKRSRVTARTVIT
jgi:hypothetical protein